MTLKAKAIIGAFYGAPPRMSAGMVSQGGRQGITEARTAADYDAVIAGAPRLSTCSFMPHGWR
jgi:hypothetical protein